MSDRIASFGVTNVVLEPKDIVVSENMVPWMKLVVLNNGEVVFINSKEEYQALIVEGLI